MNTQSMTMVALQNAAYSAKQTIRANAAAALAKANPHLKPASKEKDSLIAATKNIRIELKRAFPGVKFSVSSSRFSMGDSISVSWIDGPTTRQVYPIVNKYSAGSFDGQTDCYNYETNAWTDAFGDAKYIRARREYSDKMLESVIGRTCRKYGGLDTIPTPEDYRAGRVWNLRNSGGCDMEYAISEALSKHTYCITRG